MRKITSAVFLLIAGFLLFGCATYTAAPIGYNPSSSYDEPQKVAEFQKKLNCKDHTLLSLCYPTGLAKAFEFQQWPAFQFYLGVLPENSSIQRVLLCVPLLKERNHPQSVNLSVVNLERSLVIDSLEVSNKGAGRIKKWHISQSDKEVWGRTGRKRMLEWLPQLAGTDPWGSFNKKLASCNSAYKSASFSGADKLYEIDVTDFTKPEFFGDKTVSLMLRPQNHVSSALGAAYLLVDYDVAPAMQAEAQVSPSSPRNRLEEMKLLLDKGLITEEEYNTQKACILESI